MSETARRAEPAKLGMGRVIRTTFSGLGSHFWPLVLIAVVAQLPSTLFDLFVPTDPAASPLGNPLSNILSGIGSVFAGGAIISGVAAGLRGDRLSIGEMLQVSGQRFGSLFWQSIIVNVGVILASLLLIVPGVILAAAWSVAGPALVLEKLDAGGGISRSLELTRGNRGRIVLLALLYVFAAIVGFVLVGLISVPFELSGVGGPAIALMSGVMAALVPLVADAGATALHRELRFLKEGAGSDEVSSVFA